MPQECRNQVREREALAIEARIGKGATAEIGLDRLDEAALAGARQRMFERLRTPRRAQDGARRAPLAPEGERRAKHVDRPGGGWPGQAAHLPVFLGDRDGAVGGAEIDADGAHDLVPA